MIDDLAWAPDPSAAYRRLVARGVHRLDDGRWLVPGVADAVSVLTDPAAQVPAPTGRVRAAMARFSEGAAHGRRRAVAAGRLAALDPVRLRRRARELTSAVLDRCDPGPVDVAERVARDVPIAALAEAVGAVDVDRAVTATRRLCLALAPPLDAAAGDPDPAFAALRALVAADADEETAANTVALLFQAADATAGLIVAALLAGDRRAEPADRAVAAALRRDPPVRRTTRVAVDPLVVGGHVAARGDELVLLLAGGDQEALPFGAGRHRCPGEAHAIALAAGVVDALAARSLRVGDRVVYERRANLRVPARLLLA